MNTWLPLARRNVRLYVSDKTAVLLSLLGALIAIALVWVFLKQSLVDSLTASFAGRLSAISASRLLDAWLIPSAAVIASGTTGLGALGQFVQDRETTRWRDFLVAPLPRWCLTLGYLGAAVFVSAVMTTIVYGAGTAYCLATGVPLSADHVLQGWGWLQLCCLGFTALMSLIVACLKTAAAFSGASIIVGVLFGFLSMTYVAPSALPADAVNVLAALPFAQASALVRQPYTADLIARLPAEAREAVLSEMGITLSVGATTITPAIGASVLAGMSIVFAVASWRLMAKAIAY